MQGNSFTRTIERNVILPLKGQRAHLIIATTIFSAATYSLSALYGFGLGIIGGKAIRHMAQPLWTFRKKLKADPKGAEIAGLYVSGPFLDAYVVDTTQRQIYSMTEKFNKTAAIPNDVLTEIEAHIRDAEPHLKNLTVITRDGQQAPFRFSYRQNFWSI